MTTSTIAPQPVLRTRHSTAQHTLMIVGVVLALLALSVGAGVAAGTGRTSIAVALAIVPVLLGAAIFLSRKFVLLVHALPIAALAIPFELPTGTETKLPAALLIALSLFGLWLATMITRKQWTMLPWRLNKPILCFSLLCCFSLVWGILWRDPILIKSSKFITVQIASLVTILISPGAAILVGNFINTRTRLKYFVGAFLAFGFLMALTELFHIEQKLLNDRGLWGLWTVAPAFAISITVPKLRWHWHAALWAIILVTLYQTMVVNSDWVSGWAPTIVALVAISFFRSKKLFVTMLIVGAVGAYASQAFFAQVAEDNVNDGSLERIALWEQNWKVVSEHYLFGTGPAGYAIYYMSYFREDARSTHNNYLDILAQFGFIGMGLWLWLAGTGVYEGWRIVRRAPPGFLRALAITATSGWIGAQASMFFGDWVLPFAYNQGVGGYKYTVYTWLYLGTLLSIRQVLDGDELHSIGDPQPQLPLRQVQRLGSARSITKLL